MPTLPTVDLPQAQYDKIVSTFPGATGAEKVQNYQNWLINRLIDQVETTEMNRAAAAIASSLPTRPPDPEFA